MRARSAFHRSFLYSALASLPGLGCDAVSEPPPTVTLSFHGQVFSSGPTPVTIAGATVALRQGALQTTPKTLAETTTDQNGKYQLTHSFASRCEPQDTTPDWIEVSDNGYETASSYIG